MYGGYTDTLNQLSMLFHAPPVALPNRPVEIPFPPVAIDRNPFFLGGLLANEVSSLYRITVNWGAGSLGSVGRIV